jgi:hypothetical protein
MTAKKTAAPRPKPTAELEQIVARFNETHPVGTPVLYRSSPSSAALETRTRAPASVLSGHTAVVFVDFVSGCVALDALEVLPPAPGEADEPAADPAKTGPTE